MTTIILWLSPTIEPLPIYYYLDTHPLQPYEFVDKVAEKTGLNAGWCQYPLLHHCLISCEGFEVSITPQERYLSGGSLKTDGAMVAFRDLVAAQKLRDRQKAKEEEEKKKFRP